MKTITLYVDWENYFITTDPDEAIEYYLRSRCMRLLDYALDNDYIMEDEEFTADTKERCRMQLLDDIEQGYTDWSVRTIPIKD